MKSELPGIDAIIDEAICQVRERLAETDETIIADFMGEFVDRHPSMSLAGMAYHLGMLVVTRADCARDEFNQSLVADEIVRLEKEIERLRRKARG